MPNFNQINRLMRRPYHDAQRELHRTRRLLKAQSLDSQFGTDEVKRILAEESAVTRVRRHEKRLNDVRETTLIVDAPVGTRTVKLPKLKDTEDGKVFVMEEKEITIRETQMLPRNEALLAMDAQDRAAFDILETLNAA